VLSDRALIIAENHTIVQAGTPDEVLADRDLLLSVNLIQERSRIRGSRRARLLKDQAQGPPPWLPAWT